ncbi:site-specific integrase [Marinobacter sp. HN1S83]
MRSNNIITDFVFALSLHLSVLQRASKMSKTGQARVLTPEQFAHLLHVIQEHRYPEKNTALVQISFKLGLRVQEIALLQIKDVAELGPESSGQRSFKLKEILALPAAYTKGADALKRSKSTYQRRRVSFSVHDFHQLVQRIEAMAKAGAEIKPEDFYPDVKKHRGKSRDLPMNDAALRTAIKNYLTIRLAAHPSVKKTDPLFLTQKGGPYSPNTLQEHFALMQRHWAGIERASSHSGRRTLITNIIHEQKKVS